MKQTLTVWALLAFSVLVVGCGGDGKSDSGANACVKKVQELIRLQMECINQSDECDQADEDIVYRACDRCANKGLPFVITYEQASAPDTYQAECLEEITDEFEWCQYMKYLSVVGASSVEEITLGQAISKNQWLNIEEECHCTNYWGVGVGRAEGECFADLDDYCADVTSTVDEYAACQCTASPWKKDLLWNTKTYDHQTGECQSVNLCTPELLEAYDHWINNGTCENGQYKFTRRVPVETNVDGDEESSVEEEVELPQ